MKNGILLAILVALISAGVAYRLSLPDKPKQQNTTTTKKVSPKISHLVFEGKLPCADCKEIQTKVTLLVDEKNNPLNYTLEQLYVGKEKSSLIENGMWTIVHGAKFDKKAIVYELSANKTKNKTYYLKVDNGLQLLSTTMQKITSSSPLLLKEKTY